MYEEHVRRRAAAVALLLVWSMATASQYSDQMDFSSAWHLLPGKRVHGVVACGRVSSSVLLSSVPRHRELVVIALGLAFKDEEVAELPRLALWARLSNQRKEFLGLAPIGEVSGPQKGNCYVCGPGGAMCYGPILPGDTLFYALVDRSADSTRVVSWPKHEVRWLGVVLKPGSADARRWHPVEGGNL